MKRISYSILRAIAKVCALFAAIVGCSSQSAPEKPREIHGKGQETGFWGTTTVPPRDSTDSDGKR